MSVHDKAAILAPLLVSLRIASRQTDVTGSMSHRPDVEPRKPSCPNVSPFTERRNVLSIFLLYALPAYLGKANRSVFLDGQTRVRQYRDLLEKACTAHL